MALASASPASAGNLNLGERASERARGRRRGRRGDIRALSTSVQTGPFATSSALRHATIGEGVFGRGLLATGTGKTLVSVPVDALVAVPAAVPASDEPRARAVYEQGWSKFHGVVVPRAIVDFAVSAPFAKDVRLAVTLAWAYANVEAWRVYGDDVVPREFDSMYLANEEELEALQDPELRVMATRSKAAYEATWKAAMEAFPEVKSLLAGLSEERLSWCRSWVHTRAISGKVGGMECAFLAPVVDLANHRVGSTATYGVSADGTNFELTWNESAPEGSSPVANAEVFISYGDRMSNALLMLHYGFIDDDNRNERLPMEFIAPGARRVQGSRVIEACERLRAAGDEEAANAGANLLALAARGPPPGVDAPPPPKTDESVVQAMRDVVEASLASRPTSAEDDEALLAGASARDLSPRAHMAVRHRLAQKRAARAFLRFLSVLE